MTGCVSTMHISGALSRALIKFRNPEFNKGALRAPGFAGRASPAEGFCPRFARSVRVRALAGMARVRALGSLARSFPTTTRPQPTACSLTPAHQ